MDGNAPSGTVLRKDGRLLVVIIDIERLFTPDYMLRA